ncbi:protein arginine N-methyltransferase 1-like [Rosa chinensis]|uniref:protein arginine N-methyltransferase 1-like n=1 Tax=Rosa chinensis TaxID=74649 RepID=UPI000D089517|nr:protein arginine N-methyltransferase 1-like [Rosa chinensis]
MGYSIWEIAKAFIDNHSELTANLYTQAIVVDPNNSELHSDRTQANIKSNNLTEEENLNDVWKKEVETVFVSHGLSCKLNWDECKMTATATERTLFIGVHVVVNVGCGTGILSIFCAQASAKCFIGKKAAYALNEGMGVIEDRSCTTTYGFDIDEEVDVIISEWMGYMLLYEDEVDFLSSLKNDSENGHMVIVIAEGAGHDLLLESLESMN